MTNILRIPSGSYFKNAKILSDLLADGTVDMLVFTHEPKPNLSNPAKTPKGLVDGVCVIAATTAQLNPGLAAVAAHDNGSGQFGLRYALNSIPYYLSEFGDARFVGVKAHAVDDAGLIDMVAFSPKDLEKFGYEPAKYNYVRDVYTQGPAGAALAAVEPGSRMIVTGPASGNVEGIVDAYNVVVGPKDKDALLALFALAAKHKISVTELVRELEDDFRPSATTVPGHPAIDLSQGQA